MAGIVYADYELVERPGETETAALFKGQHVLIPERLRAVKMAQTGSEKIKAAFKPERLKELFGQFCQATSQVACALDAATPAERAFAERIGFIESIHFDAAQDPDSDKQDYIITEWVGGVALTDRLKGGALPLADTLGILTGVLEGLEYAHGHGLTHGNLKPNNLLLTPDGQPKIVDFGGNILGEGVPPRFSSLPYLSPEQLESGADIDGRADLFSLTLLFYEMLTGRRAPRLLTAAQMPSRLNPQCPAAFDELIQQGLQGDPRQRIRSAQEMRASVLDAMRMPSAPRAQESRSAPVQAFPVQAQQVSVFSTPEEPPVTETPDTPRTEQEAATAQEVAPTFAASPETPQISVHEPEAATETQPASVPPSAALTRRAGQRRVSEVDEAEMVWVPAGVLQMGSEQSAAEKPLQNVQVSGFWLYKYPVTQAQYLKLIQYMRNAHGPEGAPPRPGMFLRGDAHLNKAAAGIRWDEAQEYAGWAGGRLPTEAEWEWGARGPEGRTYPWGEEWADNRANTAETGLYEQTDVDRYTMGEAWCGALDLLGNVFEWCSTLYKPYPYDGGDGREDVKQPGPRVLRGGSANTPQEETRSSARWQSSSKTTRTGFRLVKDDEP